MKLQVLGLSHRTAPLRIRERLYFSRDKLCRALPLLKKCSAVEEGLILSTCNRTEIYSMVSDEELGLSSVKRFIGDFNGVRENEINDYIYVFRGRRAVRHLFRVAASLDSMVVGEPQILGQVKEAYFKAREYDAAGNNLENIFIQAIRLGKRIRRQTLIGKGAVSISSVAIGLAKKALGGFKGKKAMIIGAGNTAELTAKRLYVEGVESIAVTNRKFKRAVGLARIFKGKAFKFKDFLEKAEDADIIISCVSAAHFILKKEQIKKVIRKRPQRPLFLIDLGVPRNIDDKAEGIKSVYLYNIDDLAKARTAHIKGRSREAKKAEQIIKQRIQEMKDNIF